MIWKTKEGTEVEIEAMSYSHLVNTINYIEEKFAVPNNPKPQTTLNWETNLRLLPNSKLISQYEEMKSVLAKRQLVIARSSEAMKDREINLFEYL